MKKIFKEIRRLPEFERDIKKLSTKFRTIKDDLEVFTNAQLHLFHKLNIDNKGIVQIPNLGFDSPKIFKARKFSCRSLKGRGVSSGLRVIYAYYDEQDIIEFIEIYFKAEQENEDRNRIIKHYKN